MPGNFTPEISIIIVVGSKRNRSANALASILAQDEIERAEIILIDVALDRFPPIVGSDHPQVRTIQMGYELHIGAMRAYGARIARSPIVAYLEEHALALPGWLKAIRNAFARGEWAAVSGVVLPARPTLGWGTLITLINFVRWEEGTPSGEVSLLPGHNTAYRRDALLSFGNDLEQMMLTEPYLQSRLCALGYKLYLENQGRWIHLNERRADGLCFNYFCWNVMFGHQRTIGRSLAHRILRIATTPLILPVRTLKSLRRVLHYKGLRVHTGSDWLAFAWLIPCILLIHLAETLGLGLGYWGRWAQLEKALTIGELVIERETPPYKYDIWHNMAHAAGGGNDARDK